MWSIFGDLLNRAHSLSTEMFLMRQPIEYVSPQWITFRQAGMVKIIIGIMTHAELFHHSSGADVSRNGKGDHGFQSQLLGRIPDHSPRALCRETLPPVISR